MVVALPEKPWGMLMQPSGPDPELGALGQDAPTQNEQAARLPLTAALDMMGP